MLTNPIHPWNETPLSDHSTSDRARQSGQDVEMWFRRRSHRCEAIQHRYLINKLISSGKGRDGLHKWSSPPLPPPTQPACGRECYVCHVFDPAMRWSLTGFTAKVDGDGHLHSVVSETSGLIWRDEMGARAAPSLTCSGLCSLHRRRPGLPKLPKLSPMCVCVPKPLEQVQGMYFFLHFGRFKHHLAAV